MGGRKILLRSQIIVPYVLHAKGSTCPYSQDQGTNQTKKTVGLSVANHGNKGPPFSLTLP